MDLLDHHRQLVLCPTRSIVSNLSFRIFQQLILQLLQILFIEPQFLIFLNIIQFLNTVEYQIIQYLLLVTFGHLVPHIINVRHPSLIDTLDIIHRQIHKHRSIDLLSTYHFRHYFLPNFVFQLFNLI